MKLLLIPLTLYIFDCTVFEQRLYNHENKVKYHAERFEYHATQRAYRDYLRYHGFLADNCDYRVELKEVKDIMDSMR